MKKENTFLSKVVPICLILLLLGTTTYFCYTSQESTPNDEISINNNGVNLRLLSQNTNEKGETVYTFTYTITPDNATDQSVILSLKYQNDNQDLQNDEVSYTLNEQNKTIVLTCHNAFDKVILFRLTSYQTPSVYAEVELHYQKKILSLDYTNELITFGGNNINSNILNFKASSIVTPNYSIYTKDKTYTFKPKNISLNYEEQRTTYKLSTNFYSKLLSLIESKFINEGSALTPTEIWNLDESNQNRSYLEKISKLSNENNYVSIMCDEFEYYCVENPEITINDPQAIYMTMYFDFDYSMHTINVDEINVNFTEIIF